MQLKIFQKVAFILSMVMSELAGNNCQSFKWVRIYYICKLYTQVFSLYWVKIRWNQMKPFDLYHKFVHKQNHLALGSMQHFHRQKRVRSVEHDFPTFLLLLENRGPSRNGGSHWSFAGKGAPPLSPQPTHRTFRWDPSPNLYKQAQRWILLRW